MRVDLPKWREIDAKVEAGEDLTALEQFIHENEPAEYYGEEKWRESLRMVFQEFIEELLNG